MTLAMDRATVKRWVCLAAGLAALLCAAFSLKWRMVHDLPIMLYMATLMAEAHLVPYRDFFDMNLPGTYWVLEGFVRPFGCSDVSVRLFDLTWFSGVLIFTFQSLKRWGNLAALLAVCLVALRYFSGTWWFTLQREYLALLPLSAALALSARPQPVNAWSGLLMGALLSGLFLIKPQLVLFGAPVVGYSVWTCAGRDRPMRFVLSAVLGFSVPVACCIFWLAEHNAWKPFVDLATQYWPLYVQMDGAHEVQSGLRRLSGVMRGAGALLTSGYSALALAGLIVGRYRGVVSRAQFGFWLAMLAVAVLIPCLSGQFWGYHKLPFYYLALCATSVSFADSDKESDGQRVSSWFGIACGVVLAVVWISLAVPRSIREAVGPGAVATDKHGVPDRFAAFLKEHARAGDRVQPLDWTGGSIHGMLMAGARPATRFLYTFHFYHHVNSAFIHQIRGEFIRELRAARPRFLLEAVDGPHPCGEGTSETFLELEQWKDAFYHIVESGSGYRIWELNGA